MRNLVHRSIAMLSVLTLALGVTAVRSPAALAAATCTTTVTVNYSVQVCLTAPDSTATTLTGNTTVSATQSILQGSATVTRMVFTVDNRYVLSVFTAPYTFTWHTARHWVDGTHTLGVYARMSDGSDTSGNPAAETVTLTNGITTTPVNNNNPTVTTGTVPAAGQPKIVGAVGSGADGRGANSVASEVTGWAPNLFLFLGDVYEQGTYEEFDNWYDPSWGSTRSVTNPVPGDQEIYYGVQGYNWYWNNLPAYYSYDVAGWHFIAMTDCAYSSNSYPPNGLCGTSSPQLTWLNNDLAAHPGACTIAYWHEPRFALDGSGGSAAEQPLWTPLANGHVTMAVNADRHNYQRWTAMDANGNALATGMAEFVVGTGNHNWESTVGSDPRALKTIVNTPGALKLSLTTTTAGFQFIGTDGVVGDSGNIPCQGNGTLAGTVTDAGSAAAIAGATVSYNGTGPAGPVSGSTTTDSTGHYSVAGIAVTSYTMTAQATGYQSQSATATVGGGATTTQNFALTAQGTRLSGTVTDASTSKPIAGATVSAGTGSATTDASGAYTITGVAPGSYTATATAAGYTSQSATVTLAAGTTTTQNFALAPTPGTITGTVTDASTAAPIAGATVSYSGGSTTTSSTGGYTLANVAEGSYTVTAAATGYTSQSRTVTVGPGATATQNFALTALTTRLSGTVTDASTTKPVAGATVSAGTASATTDATGAYTITGQPPGTYTATATAAGYTSQSASVTLATGTTTTQNFALAPNPGTITGTVTDAATAAPIAGATVSYSGGSATTSSTGGYTLANVAEGSYTVTVSATGYTSQSQTVTVGPGATATQNFALTAQATRLSGTVTDASTSKPVAGATVSAGTGSTTTDATGAYTISGVAPGTYTATATAAGYTSQSATVTLAAGITTTQNFALAPNPGTISGTVTDAATAAPIAGATVSYSGGSTTTNSSGGYTLASVAEGSYAVTASATGYTSQSRTVTVGPGASATQNFALTPPTGAITGTVTNAGTGNPISGATVSYSGGSTTTNASGQYTLSSVAPGTYTVTASASGYSSQSQSVAVAAGQTGTANFGLRLAPFFSDGFESGTLSNWTSSAGLTVQTATVHSGTYAAEGSTITGTTYAIKQLSTTYADLYYRTYVDVKSQTTGFTLMADQTATGTGIIRLYIDPQHALVLWNDVTQLTTTGPTISLGAWHSIELHVVVNGALSTTEVWLDGALVPAFSSTMATLGVLPVGQIQLGSQGTLQIYDVVLDDVAASTSRIGQ